MSPSLKYLMVSSIAARKSSSEPMSLIATCGVRRGGLSAARHVVGCSGRWMRRDRSARGRGAPWGSVSRGEPRGPLRAREHARQTSGAIPHAYGRRGRSGPPGSARRDVPATGVSRSARHGRRHRGTSARPAAAWPSDGVTRRPAASPAGPAGAGRVAPGPTARWWDAAAPTYHAEHGALPRRRRLRLVPGGAARGRRAPARRRRRPAGARGRLRRGPVRPLAAQRQGADVGGARPLRRHAAPAPRSGRATGLDGAAGAGRRGRAAVRGRESFDLACSAFGALPFVADSAAVMREVARVLRPGGPVGVLGDPPDALGLPRRPRPGGPAGRLARTSTAGPTSRPTTRGRTSTSSTTARSATGCGPSSAPGFVLVRPGRAGVAAGPHADWGQWSPLRGALIPGTLILVCDLPAARGEDDVDLHLTGRRAVVTGASRHRPGRRARPGRGGRRVALVARDRDALEETAEAVREPGGRGAGAPGRHPGRRRGAGDGRRGRRRLGGVDVLVNAAARPASSARCRWPTSPTTRCGRLETKVLGYLRCARQWPHVAGGRIINVSGLNARLSGSLVGSVATSPWRR